MTHPCAGCALRFASSAELADHVRDEHTEHPPFSEGQATITRPRRYEAPEPPARGRHAAARPERTPT